MWSIQLRKNYIAYPYWRLSMHITGCPRWILVTVPFWPSFLRFKDSPMAGHNTGQKLGYREAKFFVTAQKRRQPHRAIQGLQEGTG